MRTPGRTQKNEQQPTWICKDQIGSNQSNFLQWQRGRAGAGGRCRRCHLSLLQEGFSSCLPWHSHQHAGKQLCIAIWLYLERDYQWLPVREGCVYQGSPDLVQFDISINLPDDGRGKMFIKSAEGSPPRKGYQHFGGHETKPSDQDLSPSDGKLGERAWVTLQYQWNSERSTAQLSSESLAQTPDGLQRAGQQLGRKRSRAAFDAKWNRLRRQRWRADGSVVVEMAHSFLQTAMKFRSSLGPSALIFCSRVRVQKKLLLLPLVQV